MSYGSNLTYPILRQTPSFGDGMRPHADGIASETNTKRTATATIHVEVDWGDYTLPSAVVDVDNRVLDNNVCPGSSCRLGLGIGLGLKGKRGEGCNTDNTVYSDNNNGNVGGFAAATAAKLSVLGIGRRSSVVRCSSSSSRHVASSQVGWCFNNNEDSNNNVTVINTPTTPTTTSITDDKNKDGKSIGVVMPKLSVSFDTAAAAAYPEYVVEFVIMSGMNMNQHHDEFGGDDDVDVRQSPNIFLRRTLHVLPPPPYMNHPRYVLDYDLSEVLWAPHISELLKTSAAAYVSSTQKQTESTSTSAATIEPLSTSSLLLRSDKEAPLTTTSTTTALRRRGFGLELETVQLPPDADAGYFTLQDEYNAAVERARDADASHGQTISSDAVHTRRPPGDDNDEKWDRLLLWNVGHDPQVENAAPPARIELYEKLQKAIIGEGDAADIGTEEERALLNVLLLGGKIEIPEELSTNLPNILSHHINQASPEYRSPFPPNELYHVFPPPVNGDDAAGEEIRLLLDGVLKNPVASNRAIICPTVSDIGQSASSIHVHVNFRNPAAWPRASIIEDVDDLQATQSLLSVVLNWIRFDGVVRAFAKPWMWRDRSLAPMFASGPEFVWREVAWKQGTTAIDEGTKQRMYNVPAFFRHIFEVYSKRAEHIGSLFDAVFDNEVIYNTLFRDCSLNLLALKKYGTVEFRRMHATLDADFVSAWTWFCVGFVEKFSDPSMFDEYTRGFLAPDTGWVTGLNNLVEAQNNATIEDLVETMAGDTDAMVPPDTFDTLMGKVGCLSQNQAA